ncbi:Cell division protein FtsL [Micrococcus lylae]|uniref:Cell division protein FtsL n=2 Tax=Micrococcus lylae TaxID=1273 RepID=A0A1R4J6R9_9MICC|nr:Cell division protein FtsL [Micrococcus lylae]
MTALEDHRMAATAEARSVEPRPERALEHVAGASERVRTPLSVVPAPLPRTGRGITVLCLGILMVALAVVLVANITVSNRQYQMLELRAQQTELSEANELLSQRVGYLEAPQNLAARADALGMVDPAGSATVDVATGRVSGEAAAAEEGERGASYVNPPSSLDQPLGVNSLEGDALPPGHIAGPELKDPAEEKKAAEERTAERKAEERAASEDAVDAADAENGSADDAESGRD